VECAKVPEHEAEKHEEPEEEVEQPAGGGSQLDPKEPEQSDEPVFELNRTPVVKPKSEMEIDLKKNETQAGQEVVDRESKTQTQEQTSKVKAILGSSQNTTPLISITADNGAGKTLSVSSTPSKSKVQTRPSLESLLVR
jgi:hypothetical protein